MKQFLPLCLALVCAATPALADSACTVDRATGTTMEKKPFIENAYAMHWNHATDTLVFMQQDPGGYYKIYTMKPNGSQRRPAAGPETGVPQLHQGAPDWHPSGKWIVFEAQKADWKSHKLFGSPDYDAMPGWGMHDDMWLVAADGSKSWKLTDEPNSKTQGVLLPVFSPDGTKIAWADRLPDGKLKYQLKVADFVETPQPHLDHIRTYQPGGAAYYETGGFTTDGKSLTYTSDQDTHSFWQSQIYRLDLDTGQAQRLTEGKFYNEHPRIISTPTGDWVVYMSTKDVKRFPFKLMLGTDWYAVRPDGTGLKRLTTMGDPSKTNPENMGAPQVAGTLTASPSGDVLLGDVQDDLVKQTGLVRVIHLTCN